MKKPDHWFYCSSCEPCQLCAIGKAKIRRQTLAFLAALLQLYMFSLVEDKGLFFSPSFVNFFLKLYDTGFGTGTPQCFKQ